MSIKVLDWALREAPVTDATETLVLVGLANHATDDGTAAFPAVKTLAIYARCSPRTVHTKLRNLEDAGIIRRGDQQLLAHWPSNRRPIVYDVNMDAPKPPPVEEESEPEQGCEDFTPATSFTPANDLGVKPEVARGEAGGSSGVNAVADKPSFNHPEPSVVVEGPSVRLDEPMQNAPANKMRRGWNPSERAMQTARDTMDPADIPLHITKYEVWCRKNKRNCNDGEWLTWVVRDEEEARHRAKLEAQKDAPKSNWYSVAD